MVMREWRPMFVYTVKKEKHFKNKWKENEYSEGFFLNFILLVRISRNKMQCLKSNHFSVSCDVLVQLLSKMRYYDLRLNKYTQ